LVAVISWLHGRIYRKSAEEPAHKSTITTSVVIDPQTTVKYGEATRESNAVIYFHKDADGDGELVTQCAVDKGNWRECSSPLTVTDLTYDEHKARFRLINTHGAVEGYEAILVWTVLPRPVTAQPNALSEAEQAAIDAATAAGSGSSRGTASKRSKDTKVDPNAGGGSSVALLKPTIEGSQPAAGLSGNIPPLSNSQVGLSLAPSVAKSQPLGPIPIDNITAETIAKAREEAKKKKEEDKFDDSLKGPFTEAQLIELTPKKLRKALRQSPDGSKYSKEDINKMDPEDIRDIFRSWSKAEAVLDTWCDEKISNDDDENGCNDIVTKKRWPKKSPESE